MVPRGIYTKGLGGQKSEGYAQCTIDHLCNMHPAEVARQRLENLKKWMSRAKELEPVEARLKELMPRHCREILSNKRLQLFKEMLEASEHKDLSLVSDMSEGFKLSGPIPKCDAFRAKRTSATLTTAALRKSAMTARKGIIHSNKGSGDLELDKATFEATQAELEKGWLYGPLRESDLPDEAVVTRRFGIKQGQKTRPIDNHLESMVNATASAVDTVSLHSAEVIAAAIARRMKLLRSSKKSSSLLMKSWDLSKAYKRLPLHETSLSDAFLCVWNPNSKQTVLYGQRVLPFGARSSVHGFCRTSLGIWVIGVSLFFVHSTISLAARVQRLPGPLTCVQTGCSPFLGGTSRKTRQATLIRLQKFWVYQSTCLIHPWVSLSYPIRKIVSRKLATP